MKYDSAYFLINFYMYTYLALLKVFNKNSQKSQIMSLCAKEI